jgi:hypothetical protein
MVGASVEVVELEDENLPFSDHNSLAVNNFTVIVEGFTQRSDWK